MHWYFELYKESMNRKKLINTHTNKSPRRSFSDWHVCICEIVEVRLVIEVDVESDDKSSCDPIPLLPRFQTFRRGVDGFRFTTAESVSEKLRLGLPMAGFCDTLRLMLVPRVCERLELAPMVLLPELVLLMLLIWVGVGLWIPLSHDDW